MCHKWKSYDVWFLKYETWHTIFFCYFGPFLLFYPPNNPKSKSFKKLKKSRGDIIIFHKCTKNHDHMLYCFLDMARNGFNYFSFFKVLKKWKEKKKNAYKYHHFAMVYQKSWAYATLVLRYGATPLTAQKVNLPKMSKIVAKKAWNLQKWEERSSYSSNFQDIFKRKKARKNKNKNQTNAFCLPFTVFSHKVHNISFEKQTRILS